MVKHKHKKQMQLTKAIKLLNGLLTQTSTEITGTFKFWEYQGNIEGDRNYITIQLSERLSFTLRFDSENQGIVNDCGYYWKSPKNMKAITAKEMDARLTDWQNFKDCIDSTPSRFESEFMSHVLPQALERNRKKLDRQLIKRHLYHLESAYAALSYAFNGINWEDAKIDAFDVRNDFIPMLRKIKVKDLPHRYQPTFKGQTKWTVLKKRQELLEEAYQFLETNFSDEA